MPDRVPAGSLLFSIIVLGLAADVISVTEDVGAFYWICMALAVATAVLTMVTVIPMYAPYLSNT